MNNLQTKFERDLSKDRFFYPNDKVIVAVSTGSDSMALLSLLLALTPNQRPEIIVAHVNHELRTQSQAEEEFLIDFCNKHQLTLEIKHWLRADHPKVGIEAAARQFRYAFFEKLMVKYNADKLVTAHHLNDQAETILMKLTRGGELTSLGGIQKRRDFGQGELIRPLLTYRKSELQDYLVSQHIKYYEDETNQTLEFSRNRYRQQILPLLMTENTEVLEHLESFATQLTELSQFSDLKLTQMYQQVQTNDELVLTELLHYSKIEQKQLIRYWLMQQHNLVKVKEQQIMAILEIIQSDSAQAKFDLGNDTTFVKEYQVARLKRVNDIEVVNLNLEDYVSTVDRDNAIEMWLPKTMFPLQIRLMNSTDEIQLKNGHHQKARRILIDQKVPNRERQQQVVVTTNDNEPLWLVNRKVTYLNRPKDYQSNWQKVYFVPQLTNQIKGD